MEKVLRNSLSFRSLTAGAELRLTGENGVRYFLFSPNTPDARHYIGHTESTDIGLSVRGALGYDTGLIQTIEIGIMNINLGLEVAGLRLAGSGFFKQEGQRYRPVRGAVGIGALVSKILSGEVYIKYTVESV